MNIESLENIVRHLTKQDLYKILVPLLSSFFSLSKSKLGIDAYNYSECYYFEDVYGKKVLVYINTEHKPDWQHLIIDSLLKARDTLEPAKCLIFSNQDHSPATLVSFCNQGYVNLNVPFYAYGLREISSMLSESGLMRELNTILGKGTICPSDQFDFKLFYFFTYFDLCTDSISSRNFVFDQYVMAKLYVSDKDLTRETLLAEAEVIFEGSDYYHNLLNSRIDSLMQRGYLALNGKNLQLSEEYQEKFKTAQIIFEKELAEVTEIISTILISYIKTWDRRLSFITTYLIAKLFLLEQIHSAKYLQLSPFTSSHFFQIGNPKVKLRQIFKEQGLSRKDIEIVIMKICDKLKNHTLISKLSHIITTLTLHLSEQKYKSLMFLAREWSEIEVFLDSPVLIHYLCAELFMPHDDKMIYASHKVVKLVQKLGARIILPADYLKEVSTLLIYASYYKPLDDERLIEDKWSNNPFISYYLFLKGRTGFKKLNLMKFLKTLSAKSITHELQLQLRLDNTMQHLQRTCLRLGIEVKDFPKFPVNELSDTNHYLSLLKNELGYNRTDFSLVNDINLLTYLKYNSLQNNRAQIFLTWDRLLLTYTSRYCHYDYAHITTPPTLNDILQIHEPLSEKELLSLVYRVSKTAWKIPKQMHLNLDTILNDFRIDIPNWHYLSELDNIHKNRARALTRNTRDHFVDPFGYNDADSPFSEV